MFGLTTDGLDKVWRAFKDAPSEDQESVSQVDLTPEREPATRLLETPVQGLVRGGADAWRCSCQG
jgi:hypothetical protein